MAETPAQKPKQQHTAHNGMLFQAGVLAGASIIVRIIGLLYRAPLTAIIGDEGIGYYGFAYNIYTIVLLISSYSIPSAISKVMAGKIAIGQSRNARRVFHCAMFYALAVGSFASLFLFFGAGLLVPPGAVIVLRAFAPTVFIFGILGVLRGYFQAYGSMVQTSVSQILEQLANAVISIWAAYMLTWVAAGKDATTRARFGAMGSALGTGSGVAIALLFMAFCFYVNQDNAKRRLHRDKSRPDSYGDVMKETMLAITPFILSGFILNLCTSLNQTIYTKTLIAQGLSEVDVTTQYGIFSNKAVVITNIPISIATAVSAAIIPGISASFAKKNIAETRYRAESVVRLTMIIAMPCTFGLIALAWPIMLLLFPQMGSLDMASSLLALLAVTVIFYSISTVTNAVLQAIGKMQMPLVSAGIALCVQTLALVYLLRHTSLGVYSLILVSVIYAVLIFAMNELFIHRYLQVKVDPVTVYIAPMVASAIMGFVSLGIYALCYKILSAAGVESVYLINLISMIPALAAAVLCYAYLMLRFRAIRKEDVLRLPKGGFILRVLKKLRWI